MLQKYQQKNSLPRRLYELWDRLISLLYPPRCILCGEVVEYDVLWCGCAVENQPLTDTSQRVWAPFVYSGTVRQGILQMKQDCAPRPFDFFTGQMLDQYRRGDTLPDWVVPVPMHPDKQKERGFNQSELLAARIAAGLAVPLRTDLLLKRENSATQHQLSAVERMANAAGAFALQPGAEVDGVVLLVDDVYTTGATMHACRGLLRQAGAASVECLAAAYTPKVD